MTANEPNPSAAQLGIVLQEARGQHRAGAGSVLDVLRRQAGYPQAALLSELRDQTGVGFEVPSGVAPDFNRLDLALARRWRCVLLRANGQQVLAAEDPWDEAMMQRAARQLGAQLPVIAVSRDRLQSWLGDTESQGGSGASMAAEGAADPGAASQASGPIVSFVDQALRAGYDRGASDVHFECDRRGVTARHRLDGVMANFARLEGTNQAQEVISRIKVLAQLDITERRLPQDGRMRFDFSGVPLDLRVSIMPSVHGEDAVLRLLDKARLRGAETAVSLDVLGFEPSAAGRIRDLAGLPSGMLLVTGPTGSGKTTTVYAALSEINTGLEKIVTIEDPVEYELPGVLQIPVNERKGLTFAKGLRSILRHDPDRILVGEIRDAETAEIAVQSALTGHLVFTTVHANSIADVVGRFRHFGLDMFGFMSSLNGVVVQRLVRALCSGCSGRRPSTALEQAWLRSAGIEETAEVPRPVGCPQCHGTGYAGRFVIAEVHLIDDAVRDMVTQGAALSALKEHSLKIGVKPLAEQSAREVVAGRTTAEEVKRVVGWL